MAEFKLSARAETDLIEIYQHTESTYGTYQAEAYVAGLERTFDLLAHFPRMGVAIEEIAAGCRRFRFQAHVVFYSEQPDRVIIRAIMHQSRQIRPGLFD